MVDFFMLHFIHQNDKIKKYIFLEHCPFWQPPGHRKMMPLFIGQESTGRREITDSKKKFWWGGV